MTKRQRHRTRLEHCEMKFRALLARLRAQIEELVPMGYQDSAGFHFGVPD